MQILCVVSQKKLQRRPQDLLLGLHHWTPLGDFRPSAPQSSFMPPKLYCEIDALAHQHAKYRQNLSVCCEDIKFFRFFKMVAAAILHFQIS